MTFSSRHPKKPVFDSSGCNTLADKRMIVCTNCWQHWEGSAMNRLCLGRDSVAESGFCRTQKGACAFCFHNATESAGHHLSLCPFYYGACGIFPRWFLASLLVQLWIHALLFSSDNIQIIFNILSAIRDFPESYLNVNKSLMVYVKEGRR